MLKFILGFIFAFLVLFGFVLWYYWIPTGEARFYVEYAEPKTEDEAAAMKIIQDSEIGEHLFELIENNTNICTNITIKFGGGDGPAYYDKTHEIIFPYSFAVETYNLFAQNNYGDTDAENIEAMVNVIEFVLVHEMAHALIDVLNIPVVGREEDAADGLASIMLIESYEEGGLIVANTADLFGLYSEKYGLTERSFMDEHSLDQQRFYQMICFVYGSDPGRYRSLANFVKLDDERGQRCVKEYEEKAKSWVRLLEEGMPLECEEPLAKS